MPVRTEGNYPFEFLVGERCSISTEKVTIASGLNLSVGAILAKTFVGTAAGANAAGNTGNPTIGAITVGDRAQAGTYRCEFTGATAFQIFGPSGEFLGTGATGTAVVLRNRLTFTITAGGTAAVAGDQFVISVTEGASTFKIATGSDAVAILAEDTDATLAATVGLAVVRLAEVSKNSLGYGAMDATSKLFADAALERRGIIVRGGF